MFRGFPSKVTHKKRIVTFQMYGKLLGKVVKGVEFVRSIEVFVIFSVRLLDFAVISRRKRTD